MNLKLLKGQSGISRMAAYQVLFRSDVTGGLGFTALLISAMIDIQAGPDVTGDEWAQPQWSIGAYGRSPGQRALQC
jgi:hypothetical protein